MSNQSNKKTHVLMVYLLPTVIHLSVHESTGSSQPRA